MSTAYDQVTVADGEQARDRLIARGMVFVMPLADLPTELRSAGPLRRAVDAAPPTDEPCDLGGGWAGYAGGAAYNPAADVSEQEWWQRETDRDERRKAAH